MRLLRLALLVCFSISLLNVFAYSQFAQDNLSGKAPASATAPGVRLDIGDQRITLTLLLPHKIERTTPVTVLTSLVSPEDVIWSEAKQQVVLHPGQRYLIATLPRPFHGVPTAQLKDLHWLRVKYEIRTSGGDVLVSGIEALRGRDTDPFVLTAAAGRIAANGRPYQVRAHVESSAKKSLRGIPITAELTWEGMRETERLTAAGRTNAAGNATLEFTIPGKLSARQGELHIGAKSGLVGRSIEQNVSFEAASYLLMDSDKDIYQPGQTLHARALYFDSGRKAVEGEDLDLRITDEENTLVSRQKINTNAFGVASFDWTIPANVRQGDYQLEITALGQEDNDQHARSAKSVRVYRYDLPNFRVATKADRPYYLPGQNAEVTVSAEYLFGQPVKRGKVRIFQEAERHWNFKKQKWEADEGQTFAGELSRDGTFTARFDLKEAQDDLAERDYSKYQDVNIAAYVTDLTTGRTEQRRITLRATREPIHVYIVEAAGNGKGIPGSYYVSAFYADGTPARCKLKLSLVDDDETHPLPPRQLGEVETNKYGLAKTPELKLTTDDDYDTLLVEARDVKGLKGTAKESVYESDAEFIQVSGVRTILKPGDPIDVTLRSTKPASHVVVQAVHDGFVLATQQVSLGTGRSLVTFPYDPRFTDEVTIVAYSLGERFSEYSYLWGSRTVIYPKNRQLGIDVKLDKEEHRPGQEGVARIAVHLPDRSGAESALGVKVVDQAVEERARTDQDFGQRWNGWWRWSLWASDYSGGFSGVTRDDLDRIDLSEPLPEDLDLVAGYLMQSARGAWPELLRDESESRPADVFSKVIDPQVKPIVKILEERNCDGKLPHTIEETKVAAKDNGADMDALRDPWGTPYRYTVEFKGVDLVLSFNSAGPDKIFDTQDDFRAREVREKYFHYYGASIERAGKALFDREGRFIRDRKTLVDELEKLGVDFEGLRDPWGKAYETKFDVSGSDFVTQAISVGEIGEKGKPLETVVWHGRVNYFAKSRERIDRILTSYVQSTGKYPTDEAGFRSLLKGQGVNLDELRDPWGNPYYVIVRKSKEYGDRVRIQQRDASGSRSTAPVTLTKKEVVVLTAGRDLHQGTDDDAQVASYSILVADQGAKDDRPRPAPEGVNLAEGTGALMGVVTDEMGAVIGNASVDAVREGSTLKFSATTDALGNFQIRNVPPGSYQVEASMRGFRTARVQAIPVEAGNIMEVSFELAVGGTTEMVTVEAEAAVVQTENASLAVNGQNVFNLVKLSPGANLSAAGMSTPRVRQDFPETMLWEPALITDQRGHARLNLKFADNITTWRLTAVASTKNGELGHAEKDLRAFQPFFVEHDPPRVLTEGDEIAYPVVLRNYLDRAQSLKAAMKPESWFTLTSPGEVPVHVAAGDASRAVFQYRATASVTGGKQQVSAANETISDAAQKTIDVHPYGRADAETSSSVIEKSETLTLHVPDDAIPGTVHGRVKIYPNLLAHVVENLEAGLERPHGCAEQTISSTYPSLLVAEMFANEKEKPPVARKAQRFLVAGYERLLGYQGTAGGFSYWGAWDNSDLSLTAYAVEFLSRAANLIEVDASVAARAEDWLVKQQGQDGTWRRYRDEDNKNALLTSAYIAETLAQLPEGYKERQQARKAALEKALAFLSQHRELLDEPYVVASYALAAKAAGDAKTAAELADWLSKNAHYENQSAYWTLERNSPFYSWGRSGRLESTAMAMRALATIRGDESKQLRRQGLLFLLRDTGWDGMWYSGQTTVQVLKTMLSIDTPRRGEESQLRIRVNGKESKTIDLPGGQLAAPPIEVDVSSLMAAGENRLEVAVSGERFVHAQFVADSYVPWKDAAVVKSETNTNSVLKYDVTYSKPTATTDDKVQCHVHSERIGHRGYGMMLGEVGLPPGVDVDRESLERATAAGTGVNRYEVQPDRVIFYMWPIAGGSDFTFEFRPRFAMRAETAPSVLYDYYNPDASVTLKPTMFEVTPGKQ